MGYEPKELTDEEWEEIVRLDADLLQTTSEQVEKCMQEMNKFIEEHEELFAGMPTIMRRE